MLAPVSVHLNPVATLCVAKLSCPCSASCNWEGLAWASEWRAEIQGGGVERGWFGSDNDGCRLRGDNCIVDCQCRFRGRRIEVASCFPSPAGGVPDRVVQFPLFCGP